MDERYLTRSEQLVPFARGGDSLVQIADRKIVVRTDHRAKAVDDAGNRLVRKIRHEIRR